MCILEVFLAIGVEGRREALHGLAILIPFIDNMKSKYLKVMIIKSLFILR